MQSIKYVRVVKPVKVLEDDKIGPRKLIQLLGEWGSVGGW